MKRFFFFGLPTRRIIIDAEVLDLNPKMTPATRAWLVYVYKLRCKFSLNRHSKKEKSLQLIRCTRKEIVLRGLYSSDMTPSNKYGLDLHTHPNGLVQQPRCRVARHTSSPPCSSSSGGGGWLPAIVGLAGRHARVDSVASRAEGCPGPPHYMYMSAP